VHDDQLGGWRAVGASCTWPPGRAEDRSCRSWVVQPPRGLCPADPRDVRPLPLCCRTFALVSYGPAGRDSSTTARNKPTSVWRVSAYLFGPRGCRARPTSAGPGHPRVAHRFSSGQLSSAEAVGADPQPGDYSPASLGASYFPPPRFPLCSLSCYKYLPTLTTRLLVFAQS